MKKYVLANWKSHKSLAEAEEWLATFCRQYRPDPAVEVIIAPPAPYLFPLRQRLEEQNTAQLHLAVQDLSPFPLGAYTGAIAAEMVRDLVEYALVGHSERRRYFHETNQEVANKISEAVAVGIKPVVYVDRSHAAAQIAAVSDADQKELIIGYGPLEAIGMDIPQSPELAAEAVAHIHKLAPACPVLYGGSINATNAGQYMRIPGLAGLLVGHASLDPEEFSSICRQVSGA